MKQDDLFEISVAKFPQGDLTGKYKTAWTEESFNFENSDGSQKARAQTRNYLGDSISDKKIKTMLGVAALGLILILARVFYLQVIKGEYYRSLAEGNRIRLWPIAADRGIIFDHNNKELVENVPGFILSIVPQDLPRLPEDKEKILAKTAAISGVPEDKIKEIINKYGSYSYESLVIKENLDYDLAISLYIKNADLPGVLVESNTKRRYVYSGAGPTSTPSSSHLLGYLGKLDDEEFKSHQSAGYLLSDNIGKTGLERYYEDLLRGTYGRKKIEVNSLGKEQNVLAVEPPVPGKNLILTLDLEAQNTLEKLVRNSERAGNRRVAAIALDPRNGAILAMVSWPSFDNNDFSGGIKMENYQKYINDADQPLFNRVISGTYPSGSLIKLVVAAAALQEKIVNRETVFNSMGGIMVDRWLFKDWKAGGHGWTNVTKALAWSVNTYFYYVGGGYKNFTGLGLERLVGYMKKFNLAQKTGIDLPAEQPGFLPSRDWKMENKEEPWFIGDTYNLSIGQGDLLVTPLQAAVWTAAIANGGKVVQPHLGDKYIDTVNKKTVNLEHPIVRQGFVSAANIEIVKQGMRECVTVGSCQLLGTLPFSAAGKTGTAQWSGSKPTHAWFTSFAPLKDPQIVVTVLVEEGGEGSRTAMPIARNFLAWWGKRYLTH